MPRLLKNALIAIGAGVALGWPDASAISTPIGVLLLLSGLWSLNGSRQAWKGFGFAFLAGVTTFAIQLHWLSVVSWLGAIELRRPIIR